MKNSFMRDKKGGEKIFSIWWFFVLTIVGLGIVAGVLIFYSADVDVREVEADILYDKIADCIIEQGFLIDELFDTNLDIFSECNLNKEVVDSDVFYFNISVYENKNLIKNITAGNKDFEMQCRTQEENEKGEKIEAEHWAKCVRKTENILYYENNQIKIASLNLLTASNQEGEKIKF